MYTNQIWTDQYYKKIMKFTHIEDVINTIKLDHLKKLKTRREKIINEKNQFYSNIKTNLQKNKLPNVFVDLKENYMNKSIKDLSLSSRKRSSSLPDLFFKG